MGSKKPTILSTFKLRWMLNLYPPLLFSRVRVTEISPDFLSARIVVRKGLLNRNLHGTIFGGAIYAAADPLYAILYWQAFARRGQRVECWLKAASADYRKPGATDLVLDHRLRPEDLDEAWQEIQDRGRTVRKHSTAAVDRAGEICAVIDTYTYIRLPKDEAHRRPGF